MQRYAYAMQRENPWWSRYFREFPKSECAACGSSLDFSSSIKFGRTHKCVSFSFKNRIASAHASVAARSLPMP
jgi:hypothetical protein